MRLSADRTGDEMVQSMNRNGTAALPRMSFSARTI
jgi:hypothetical protein